MTSSILAKLLAAKVLAATAGATALGGVALAAATGTLPAGAQNAAHDLLGAPAYHSAAPFVNSQEPVATASPSPSLVGLCHAYQAAVATAPGTATSNPAFMALITAAGTAEKVSAFCSQLVVTPGSGAPSALPSQARTHRPTNVPQPPVTHPTSAPTAHPTSAPDSHPASVQGTAATSSPSHPLGRP